MSITDIEGAKPCEKKHQNIATRDIMNIKDIDGAMPSFGHEIPERKEGFGKPYSYDPMNYRDVTHTQFISGRHTNPLMPTYQVRDENKEVKTIGDVQGSHPNALPPKREDPNFQKTSLQTGDIMGCATGTGTRGNFHTRERKDFITTNVTADVPGA